MSNSNVDDDLVPEKVEGYTVGEKKTIDEYKTWMLKMKVWLNGRHH